MAQLRIAEKDYVIEQLKEIYSNKLKKYKEKLTATQSTYRLRFYNPLWEYAEDEQTRHIKAFKANTFSTILEDGTIKVVLNRSIEDKKLLKSLKLRYGQYKEKLEKQKQNCMDQLMIGSSEEALKMLQDFRKL